MRIQKTIVTVISAAASLMLVAGTFAPVAYGAVNIAATSCTTRADITGEEANVLAPGFSTNTSTAVIIAAGTVLSETGAAPIVVTPYWGVLCTYTIVKQVTNILFLIVGILSVAMIIYAAFLFLTEGANPKSEETARHALLFAIIGLAVAIAAHFIPSIALGLLGVH